MATLKCQAVPPASTLRDSEPPLDPLNPDLNPGNLVGLVNIAQVKPAPCDVNYLIA